MTIERRRLQRKRPGDISYIQFEAESGGIVLNASEEGLAFQAATSTERSGEIELCISPSPQIRISVTAQIVWMDEQKKSGGVRFANLTADRREQIAGWLTQTPESRSAQKHVFPPDQKTEDALHAYLSGQNQNGNLPLPPAPATDVPYLAKNSVTSFAVGRDFSRSAYSNERFLEERQRSLRRSRIRKGIAAGLLIGLCILGPISLIQGFRIEVGNSLIRLGMKLKGNPDPFRRVSESEADRSAVANSVPSSRESDSDSSSLKVSEQQGLASDEHNAKTPSLDAQPNDSNDVAQHAKILSRGSSRSESVRRLWSAIGKGDVSAEVDLAQLYLNGDGVHKNCEQARVLLQAASKGGNVEAQHQLQKLKKSGCR